MSVNDEVIVGSDSFFEVDQYKRTVKRQDDGFRLCTELMALIQVGPARSRPPTRPATALTRHHKVVTLH